MEYRIQARGQSIPVSNRYRAMQMFTQGRSIDEVVSELGVKRDLARSYRADVRAQQRELGAVDDFLAVKIPLGMDQDTRAALQTYLADLCVPVFLSSRK